MRQPRAHEDSTQVTLMDARSEVKDTKHEHAVGGDRIHVIGRDTEVGRRTGREPGRRR